MDNHALISIIVPVYNIERFLPKCLDTLARQTYEKLEIILVDDGSTDCSGAICDEFAARDPRAKVIHHKENKQLWAARNTGQEMAHGDYIMFVDGDDYLHLDAIRIMYEAITREDGYDMAIIRCKITSSANEDIETDCPGEYVPMTRDEVMDGFFKTYNFNNIWNKLYKRTVIEDIWSHPYLRAQDVDYCFRSFLKIKDAIWVKKRLYFYVQRNDSAVNKPGASLQGLKCVVRLLYDNIISLPEDKKEYQHYLLKKLYEKMINLIKMTWNTTEREASVIQCRQYEKKMHWCFWNNPQMGITLKLALFVNVRYPYCVRFLKRLVGNRFSWSRIGNI